jgi:CRP-like cAMP-binding protein
VKGLDELLAEHPLFAGLGEDVPTLLAGCGRNVHRAAEAYLFRTGSPADRFYLVRHGLVALELVGTGGSPVVVDTVAAGGVVGLSWLVPPYRWYLDARAVEPTDAIELDAACLRAKCDSDPRVGYLLLRRLVHQMYERMQASRLQMLDVYGARSGR